MSIADVINLVIAVCTFFTLLLAVKTFKEQRIQRDIDIIPYMAIYPDEDLKKNECGYFVLKNIGNGTALNVSVTFKVDPQYVKKENSDIYDDILETQSRTFMSLHPDEEVNYNDKSSNPEVVRYLNKFELLKSTMAIEDDHSKKRFVIHVEMKYHNLMKKEYQQNLSIVYDEWKDKYGIRKKCYVVLADDK